VLSHYMVPLLLLLLVGGAGSSLSPLQLSQVCHPPGSASAWVGAASGNLEVCDGAIESNGARAIYVPDIGAPIILKVPADAHQGINVGAVNPRCLLQIGTGSSTPSQDLQAVIVKSYTATAGVRHAVLCRVPALTDASFPGGGGATPNWAKLWVKLDQTADPGSFGYPSDGLPVWFFGLLAQPHPSVTWAAGGALITLSGFNMAIPGAAGSDVEGGGGGTAGGAAAITGATVGMTCRFSLAPNSSYNAPWHLILASGGALPLGSNGLDSLAVQASRNATICKLPLMPRGFVPQPHSVLVSVSPDPYTVSFCAPRNLSLFTGVPTSSSVARSSREGGFQITVSGDGFPPPSLPSSSPRISFGSTAAPASFVTLYEPTNNCTTGNCSAVIAAGCNTSCSCNTSGLPSGSPHCACGCSVLRTALATIVPAHLPGLVMLAVSFDGQTFARGERLVRRVLADNCLRGCGDVACV
jgi:hypothetical protein